MKIRFALILLTLVSTTTVQAAELGRLFFTQNERAQLERQHVLSADEPGNDSHSLIVNGMIQRDGGKRIIWINGEQQAAGSADSRTPASVPVILPGKTESVKVKVGQRLMLDSPVTPSSSQPSKMQASNDD
ncbi:hypothetical protein [Sideroxydans sp.]